MPVHLIGSPSGKRAPTEAVGSVQSADQVLKCLEDAAKGGTLCFRTKDGRTEVKQISWLRSVVFGKPSGWGEEFSLSNRDTLKQLASRMNDLFNQDHIKDALRLKGIHDNAPINKGIYPRAERFYYAAQGISDRVQKIHASDVNKFGGNIRTAVVSFDHSLMGAAETLVKVNTKMACILKTSI